MGLVMNMVPVMAEGTTYSMEYEKLSHQSAVVYQPTTKTTKTGVGVVVMHSDEDYMGLAIICSIPSKAPPAIKRICSVLTSIYF